MYTYTHSYKDFKPSEPWGVWGPAPIIYIHKFDIPFGFWLFDICWLLFAVDVTVTVTVTVSLSFKKTNPLFVSPQFMDW